MQTALCKSTIESDPPYINPIPLVCVKDENSVMVPVTLPPDVSQHPYEVLKLMICSCSY